MTRSLPVVADLVAIVILAFGMYFPRHRRKDMLVAYIGVNIGVLAVAQALSSATVGAGLGLGLFGVLSIIRLRSSALDHDEIAYYFAALAMGLLAGFEVDPPWLSPALMAALLIGLFIADHPRLFGRYRVHVVTLDEAITDEARLRNRLEHLLTARVHRVIVRRIDLVSDTMSVEVRYQVAADDPVTVDMPALEQIG